MIDLERQYPKVLDEFCTIATALDGVNIARCGDGEAKIACGFGYSREPPNEALRDEMQRLMMSPAPGSMTCIPSMDPAGPKYANWTRHKARITNLCSPHLLYGSAFVSRPDSAPWIATPAYGQMVQRLWEGKRAVVLCERKGSMFFAVRPAARKAIHIECPRYQAYDQIDRLEAEILEAAPEVCILSAGPTATCLANRLAGRIHAIDLGSAGRFISRMLAA